MTITFHNTLTRSKEPFTPIDPNRVTVYACGPTVYNFAHIGNARPAVVFDVLVRLLEHRFERVVYARNITDLDDKIYAAAGREGVPIDEVTRRYTAAYHDDMAALGVRPPTVEPRATGHIPQMVRMIETLIERGHAYAADGHVLFNVPSYPDYGRLSRRDRREMLAGARVEVAPYKKDPADFVLWKPSPDDLPGWESPWGRGRPGWHLECSTMIEEHLGTTIDIHAGGNDLIFPHHENEIAQSTCAHGGAPFCRFWLHNGFVNVEHEKMSKSLGNVLLVRDLLERAPGEAIRMVLLTAHYRKPLDWTDDAADRAVKELDRLYGTLRDLDDAPPVEGTVGPPADVVEALEDDLNTPVARARLFELARAAAAAVEPEERARRRAELVAAGSLLGLLEREPAAWFAERSAGLDADWIAERIAARNAARAARDFAAADGIRDELAAQGIVLEDGPEGTQWRKAG